MLQIRLADEPPQGTRRFDNDEGIASEPTAEDAGAICEIFQRYLQERSEITVLKPRGKSLMASASHWENP